MAASAAYWLASASSEMVITNTGELGSIGVVAIFRDTSAKDEKQGIQNIEVVSSVSPNKRLDPKTSEGKQLIQNVVDELANIFVETVATNRNVSVDDVLNNFGKGGMLVAQSAITAGMADKIGSFENLISSLIKSNNIGGIYMSKKITEATAQDVKIENPELYKAIQAEVVPGITSIEAINQAKDGGFKLGQEFENTRIQEIESLCNNDNAAIISEHKFNTEMTKEDVALAIVTKQEKDAKEKGANIQADAQAIDGVQPDNTSDEDVERASAVENMVAGMNDQRKGRRVSAKSERGQF